MTRPEGVATLRRLAGGLAPDMAGCARLLERIAQSDAPEFLRDLLIEGGARALLEEEAGR
jgi:hypothetical protein